MVFQFLTVFIEFFLCYLLVILFIHCKKAMSECANSDVDNGGAEPKAAGVGIFRPPHVVWIAPQSSTSEFRAAFFTVYIRVHYSTLQYVTKRYNDKTVCFKAVSYTTVRSKQYVTQW
jgi:hypothetical protein